MSGEETTPADCCRCGRLCPGQEKLVEYYNEICEVLGIVKPHAVLKACAVLDKIVELIKDELTKWYYPSKGELPKESGVYLVKVNYHDGKTSPFISICEFDIKYPKWFFYGNKDIVAWQYIYPPKEEE